MKSVPLNPEDVIVSVVIPCKNECDNVEPAVKRIPQMGGHTEIIFCDDKSSDGTSDVVRRMQKEYPEKDIKLLEGPGICKAKNVWTGFRAASGDILMILDGDLTVMPEELPHFFDAIVSGRGDLIIGNRFAFPMQKRAMKFANKVGNKIFGMMFSYILERNISDTLCGTKVLWKKDWKRIESLIGSWRVEDKWGDFELIFGAAKINLSIINLPVHYTDRKYGVSKMTNVFSNAMNMFRMTIAAWKTFRRGRRLRETT
jgi:glycosyltransferase involved in cell wall biosynthesis